MPPAQPAPLLSESFELVSLTSGGCSLRSRDCGETFHPVIGPLAEARILHVEQQRLAERAAEEPEIFTIWDVGLGAAANALAAIEELAQSTRRPKIEVHSFDQTLAPLTFAIEHAAELAYPLPHLEKLRTFAENGCWSQQHPSIEWHLHLGDFSELLENAGTCNRAAGALSKPMSSAPPHAIFYDPYSPKANPRLWTLEHFAKLRAMLDDRIPCLLTNYTRSTAVRVTLLLAGFFVGRGVGIGEKDQTTIASNCRDLLASPLDSLWLERVRRSTAAAPLRENVTAQSRISDEQFAALLEHPQFTGAA